MPIKKRKINIKKRFYNDLHAKNTASGESISPQIDVNSIETIQIDQHPTKSVDQMSYNELINRFGVPKEFDIFRNPIRNEKAYAIGMWLAKRKIKPSQKKNQTRKRLHLHMGVRCCDCIHYGRLYNGSPIYGCKDSMAKVSRPQSMRVIDCAFYVPKDTIHQRNQKRHTKRRSEYVEDVEEYGRICEKCGYYPMENHGGYTFICPRCGNTEY